MDKLQALSQELGNEKFSPYPCDVSNVQEVKTVSKEIVYYKRGFKTLNGGCYDRFNTGGK